MENGLAVTALSCPNDDQKNILISFFFGMVALAKLSYRTWVLLQRLMALDKQTMPTYSLVNLDQWKKVFVDTGRCQLISKTEALLRLANMMSLKS